MQKIHPYKLRNGGWVFDDPAKGLVKEGLVLGIDLMLDDIADQFEIDPEVGFDVGFSKEPIENAEVVLTKIQEIEGQPELFGTDYMDQDGLRGWLCPNLLKYFDLPPDKIYCKIMLDNCPYCNGNCIRNDNKGIDAFCDGYAGDPDGLLEN